MTTSSSPHNTIQYNTYSDRPDPTDRTEPDPLRFGLQVQLGPLSLPPLIFASPLSRAKRKESPAAHSDPRLMIDCYFRMLVSI